MITKFIGPGTKVELKSVDRPLVSGENYGNKTYYTKIYDVVKDDRLEIMMPMEQTKLILLPVDGRYDMVFYGKAGLYQCFGRIVDRYKSDNVYILVVELTSSLRKFQRREYYRLGCAIELGTRLWDEEEVEEESKDIIEEKTFQRAVMVDLSGGGLRFVSTYTYELESIILCSFKLNVQGTFKEFEVLGKVLHVNPTENRKDVYEHRVQFVHTSVSTREEIIKYIFEEERKTRKKESGN